MDVVKREEFEVVKAMAAKAREENEALSERHVNRTNPGVERLAGEVRHHEITKNDVVSLTGLDEFERFPRIGDSDDTV